MPEIVHPPHSPISSWDRWTVGEVVAGLTILTVKNPGDVARTCRYLVHTPECAHPPYWVGHQSLQRRVREGRTFCKHCIETPNSRKSQAALEREARRAVKPSRLEVLDPNSLAALGLEWPVPGRVAREATTR